jgi:PKD repeat protein
MNMRWWKSVLLWEGTGVTRIELYEGALDALPNNPASSWTNSYWGDPSSYVGWGGQKTNDWTGCGPRPSVDGLAMISWWLTRATPIAHWLSGNQIVYVDPLGGYTNGPPGLHFWEWQFANGTTNTFVWADEALASGVTTNFGVELTDIFSNQWNGPIGIEPVIAWGWPNNSMGGSFSIVPMAAFNASPTHGPAPMTVTFTDDSAGAITSRSWQFGDGFVTNTPEITVVHRYTTPGSNAVQLIVSGPSGASTNTQSDMVIVTPFPPPLNGVGTNGFPPVTGGNTGGTNNVSPAGGGANSNWRLLITY